LVPELRLNPSQHLADTRKKEFYEKPTQERKRKAAAAVKRQVRRSSRDITKRQRLF